MTIIVLGIGNLLLSDDGIGVHAVRRLSEQYDFPPSVTLLDGGTKGLDLLPFIEGSDKVLIIDAANFNREPGTIDCVEGENIPAFLSANKLSVHQIGLPDMLFAARFMDITPREMCLVGIQPHSMETGTDLSDVLSKRLDLLLETVLKKLKEWGVEAASKSTPSSSKIP